jgi:hypothetical protein
MAQIAHARFANFRPPPPEGSGMFLDRLRAPRAVHTLDQRPAVLLGWITDAHGRRLWAEIVRHTQFVRPEDILEEDPVDAAVG